MSYIEPNSPGSLRRLTNRTTNRHSVTALFSMAAEQDVEVGDDLARGAYLVSLIWRRNRQASFVHSSPIIAQKRLRDLKTKISAQSKKNFVLDRDVRYLDSRIALLIQNRMALDEVSLSILHHERLQTHFLFRSNTKLNNIWKMWTPQRERIQTIANYRYIHSIRRFQIHWSLFISQAIRKPLFLTSIGAPPYCNTMSSRLPNWNWYASPNCHVHALR